MGAMALASLFIAYTLVIIAFYVLQLNPREKLNRLAALVYLSFAVWSFCYTLVFYAKDEQTAMLWHRIGSFGWAMFCPFATHFYLVLSEKAKKLKGILLYIVVYSIPAAIIVNALFNPNGTSVASGFVSRAPQEGWSYVTNIGSFWYWIYLGHLILFFSVALKSMHSWAKNSKRRRLISQSKYVLLLNTVVLLIGGSGDLILPLFIPNIPPICHFVSFIWGLGYLYIINSLKLMSPIAAATPDIILRTVLDPILVLNGDGIIFQCNQATEDILKLSNQQIVGRPLSDFFKAKEYNQERLHRLLTSKTLRNVVIDLVDSEGDTKKTRASFSVAENILDGIVGIVVNMHDVTALKKAEQRLNESNKKYLELSRQLEKLVNYDALTGLPNRRLLIEKLDMALADYEVSGKTFALVFADIDRFKGVNDVYGHDIGDKLLQRLAEIFKSCVRSKDLVTRVGGDEFILFLYTNDEFNPDDLGDRIRAAFSEPIIVDNCLCDIGISLGISKCPQDGNNRDDLMRIADNRMYLEKATRTSHR
ncbi:MAG: sensor domain-containing diguanylate cyclase [Clostridia bacterium]|nr:sensor domain-containing diguanylate cyclase [Clostridia bacterium]